MVVVDVVRGRYQRKLLALKALEKEGVAAFTRT